MLYTRKGDTGRSGLFGTKERYDKDSHIYEALGTIDELNSLIGICRARANDRKNTYRVPLCRYLLSVQQKLFIVQAELAGADKAIKQHHVVSLESDIKSLESGIEDPRSFVVAGNNELSAFFDYARTVARRAERRVVAVHKTQPLSPATLAYLNRLSSLLYVAARFVSSTAGLPEIKPDY